MTARADELRGHPFLPEEVASAIPPLYATERTPLAEKTVWVRYFAGGACEWLVMEYDPESGISFGWVNLGDRQNAELGYFSMPELQEIVAAGARGLPIVVERDLDWTPAPFGEG